MKKIEIIFGLLRIPLDFIVIYGSIFLAYAIRPYTDLIPGVQYVFNPELLPSPYHFSLFDFRATILLIAIFAINGMYSLKTTHGRGKELFSIIFSAMAWVTIIISYYFLVIHELFFSRIILAHSFIFIIFFVFIERILIDWLQIIFLKKGYGKRNLLLIGMNKDTKAIYKKLLKDPRYTIMGALHTNTNFASKSFAPIIGTINQFSEIIPKKNIDEVLCTDAALTRQQNADLIDYCQEEHISYRFLPALDQFNYSHVEIGLISGIPILSLEATPLEGWGKVIKRSFDIFSSAFLLLLLFPFFCIIALAIKVDSTGPILYKSYRVGRGGKKTFAMYKFRSMVVNAEEKKQELLAKSHRKGPLFKIKNDPRVTKLGKFLRKSSVDELPQLFNVLIGNMSLVGPRAHLPDEVAQYQNHHKLVLAIKPGITGLAQINGRSDLDFEKEVDYDTFYIKNWTFWLDLKILLKTITVVLKGSGAD